MKFSLTKNKLYKKENDPPFVASTRVNKRLNKEDVIKRLSYCSTLTEADIHAVLSGLEKILIEFLELGHSIDLGFFSMGFRVKGGFDSEKDCFRKGRNWIDVNMKVKKNFISSVNAQIKPQKVRPKNKTPQPVGLKKLSGDKSRREFQSGNLVRISGDKLAFHEDDTETGVFLQKKAGRPIRVMEYAKVGNASILFKLPSDIKPGVYEVEVRSRSSNGFVLRGSLGAHIKILS